MRRYRFAVGALTLVAVAGLLAVSVTGNGRAMSVGIAVGIAVYGAALTLVEAFDVWLPRGDYSEMGAALVVSALILLGPEAAAAATLAARLLVCLTRKGQDDIWRTLEDISRRLSLVLLSWIGARILGIGLSSRFESGAGLERVAGVVLAYFLMDLAIGQGLASLRLETPVRTLLIGNIRLQGLLVLAQACAAVLAVLTYPLMGGLGIAIVVGLLLVMRRSFSLLMEVRQAYRSTIEVLARAIEAHDASRRGHSERVAQLASAAGRLMGLQGRRLESLTYAALFHDLSRLGESESGADGQGSAEILSNVTFMNATTPILRILDSGGQLLDSPNESDLIAAYVVARMSEFDEQGLRGRSGTGDGGKARAIGARLYADTRRTVDRCILRAQTMPSMGRLLPQSTHEASQ